jgi:hypothetical protein
MDVHKAVRNKKIMLAEFILGNTGAKKGAFVGFVTFDLAHKNTRVLYLGQPYAAACADTEM